MVSEILATATTIMGTAMGASVFLQALKIMKRKSSADVSLPTYVVFLIGGILWMLYGMDIGSYPLIVANPVGVLPSSAVIFFGMKYKKK